MNNKNSKTIILNSLIFIFCVIIIVLYCLEPKKNTEIASLQTYEVIFNTDGGSAIASIDVEEGKAITPPEIPTKEGYIFDGWVVDNVDYDFNELISGNVVLKARWRELAPDAKVYTISFLSDGEKIYSDMIIIENELLQRPNDPIKDGFIFVEWQLDGVTYNFDTPVTSDFSLNAVWEEMDPEDDTTYKVTFDLNGGSGSKPADQEVKKGARATVPSGSPSRDGYNFVGWNTNRNASRANITTTTITGNTTFYAIWQANTPATKYYTVRFEGNGGSLGSGCGTQTIREGGYPNSGCNATRNGYALSGWGTSASGGSSYNNYTSIVVNSDITIYARWDRLTTYNYSIAYNNSGCTDYNNSSTALSVDTTICRTPSSQTFKTFIGFSANGKTYSSGDKITLYSSNPSISMTPVYEDISYSVSCSIIAGQGNGSSSSCIPQLSPNDSSLILKSSGTTKDKIYNFNSDSMSISVYNNHSKLSVCLRSSPSVCASSNQVSFNNPALGS